MPDPKLHETPGDPTPSTRDRLVEAATALLDEGGQEAVTLRAVAARVGVSHNAPYRHFRDRNALLGGVARADFAMLAGGFAQASEGTDTRQALHRAAMGLIDYGRAHPARYRLLFSDPALPSDDAELTQAAMSAFEGFLGLVARAQGQGILPGDDPVPVTGLIYATLHGAIDLEIGGRARGEKGLGRIEETAGLLFDLLAGGQART